VLHIEWKAENENISLTGDIKIESLLENMNFFDIETELTINENLIDEEHYGLYNIMKTRGIDEIKSVLSKFSKNLKNSFVDVGLDEQRESQKSPKSEPEEKEEKIPETPRTRKKRKYYTKKLEENSSISSTIFTMIGYGSILAIVGASFYFVKKKYFQDD
jgi:hypothetical protein